MNVLANFVSVCISIALRASPSLEPNFYGVSTVSFYFDRYWDELPVKWSPQKKNKFAARMIEAGDCAGIYGHTALMMTRKDHLQLSIAFPFLRKLPEEQWSAFSIGSTFADSMPLIRRRVPKKKEWTGPGFRGYGSPCELLRLDDYQLATWPAKRWHRFLKEAATWEKNNPWADYRLSRYGDAVIEFEKKFGKVAAGMKGEGVSCTDLVHHLHERRLPGRS